MVEFKKSALKIRKMSIDGEEYPAIFSFAAIAEIEEKLKRPHAIFMDELANNTFSMPDFVTVLCCCLRAGGTEVEEADIMGSLTYADYTPLVNQLVDVLLGGSGKGSKGGKGKNAVKK